MLRSVLERARRRPRAGKGPQSEAPWVATGAPADAQYSSARRDARDHMRMRNAFFQQVRILAQQQCTLVLFCVPACC